MKKSVLLFLTAALCMSFQTVTSWADTTTDFENWTPDGNGGYTSNTGQTGSDGSANVNVSDGGSGKSESSSHTGVSGSIVNTETEKESSVTVSTTVSTGSSQEITKVENGQLVPVVDKNAGTNQNIDKKHENVSDLEEGKKPSTSTESEDKKGSSTTAEVMGDKGTSGSGATVNNNYGNSTLEKNDSGINAGNDRYDGSNNEIIENGAMVAAESIQNVEISAEGKWIITYRFYNGSILTRTFDSSEDARVFITGAKTETGESVTKKYTFHRSEELEEWFFKYYSWRAVNITYRTSSYYGIGKIVAQTQQNSAKFVLSEAGKYRIIATPFHDVRHYHIYEWEDDDGDTHREEVTDYWEYDRTKSPDVYSVTVPIITNDSTPPTVCINGACDCSLALNAVCDEANEPVYDIEKRVELEK